MKGILSHNDKGWYVIYSEDVNTYNLDVRPGRIDDLNSVGTYLKNGQEVDFVMEESPTFPYRYAVPYVETASIEVGPLATSTVVATKTKKQYKITLWLVGFHEKEVVVICDRYDASSSGYFYFYNKDEQGNNIYLCNYPIARTAFHKMEFVETVIF